MHTFYLSGFRFKIGQDSTRQKQQIISSSKVLTIKRCKLISGRHSLKNHPNQKNHSSDNPNRHFSTKQLPFFKEGVGGWLSRKRSYFFTLKQTFLLKPLPAKQSRQNPKCPSTDISVHFIPFCHIFLLPLSNISGLPHFFHIFH